MGTYMVQHYHTFVNHIVKNVVVLHGRCQTAQHYNVFSNRIAKNVVVSLHFLFSAPKPLYCRLFWRSGDQNRCSVVFFRAGGLFPRGRLILRPEKHQKALYCRTFSGLGGQKRCRGAHFLIFCATTAVLSPFFAIGQVKSQCCRHFPGLRLISGLRGLF